MAEAKALVEKMGMVGVEWMPPGARVQRTWYTEWPDGPHLKLAMEAAVAGKWVMVNLGTGDRKWRFDVAGRRSSKKRPAWPPKEPAAWPSLPTRRGAGVPLSEGNPWRHPLVSPPRPAHSSSVSTEDVRQLIQAEVTRLLAPYEQWLAEAKERAVRQDKVIADKEAEIASLKQELTAAKAQAKSSAVPAAVPMSLPDPKRQQEKQEKQELRQLQRVVSGLDDQLQGTVGICLQIRERQDQIFTRLDIHATQIRVYQNQLETQRQELEAIEFSPQPATKLMPKKGRRESTVMVPSPQAFDFGGAAIQQPLPEQPQWPACPATFVFGSADTAVVLVAPEPLRETAPERPPGPELSEKGEADEKEPEAEPEPEGVLPVKPQLEQPRGQPGEEGAEDEKKPEGEQESEGVLQVTPQLASGGNTPTKSQPEAVKGKRVLSPGGTPVREEVLRQNAIADDAMSEVDAEVSSWVVAEAAPRKGLF
jgi:hypothetical protein